MEKDNTLLGLVLTQLGAFSIETFADRLIIQKKVYFVQKFGIDMGYHYSWYIKGPYCTALTSSAYDLIPRGVHQFSDYSLNADAIRLLERVNNLEQLKDKVNLSKEDWYELIASVDYLRTSYSWLEDKTKEGVFEKLMADKPQFTRAQFDYAWEVLEQQGLIEV